MEFLLLQKLRSMGLRMDLAAASGGRFHHSPAVRGSQYAQGRLQKYIF
ncbi:MAG TPA: hypothetical protein IAD24_05815 [Candidatus Aphodomorpha intestinavium]|uniref:Uncharacterized protein n=1 Tax=Candidatus Aphodomorpha intestinavium TaxID=2840672 RepID=A0A9D1STE3_9FIRM|nr:hypothetical protein [Candidatus Aphodomorpha intestinavium]